MPRNQRDVNALSKHVSVVCACAGLALSGCAERRSISAGVNRSTEVQLLATWQTPDTSKAVATILSGFDLAPTRSEWQIGDRVLIGMRATKPDATLTRFLLVELTGEPAAGKDMVFNASSSRRTRPYAFSSPGLQTSLKVFDEQGTLIDTATGKFPMGLIGYGPFDGVDYMIDHPEMRGAKDLPEAMTDEEYDRLMRGWLTLFAFSGSMNKRGMFKNMVQDVIAKPSWLAMLLNPSAEMAFGDKKWPSRVSPWSDAGLSIPTVSIPLQMKIAGTPALVGEMLAVEPVAPLSLCGGLVRARAQRPDNPDVRVDLWLIACARGGGGKPQLPAARE